MKWKVALLARGSRPSGALMAWRLVSAGYDLLILAEARGKMLRATSSSRGGPKDRRGDLLNLIRRHGFSFLRKRLAELLMIKAHFYGRKFLRRHFKSTAYLSLEELALDYPLNLREVEHNGPETLRLLKDFAPDIGILTNTRRIRGEILSLPRLGFLNLHASLLPKYAGLDAIFWALYHGEKEIGMSVHFATEEIDRGGILLQEKIPVTGWDDEASLGRKSLWLGSALMMDALRGLQAGTLAPRPQSSEGTSYFSWPTAAQRKELKQKMSFSVIPAKAGIHDPPVKPEDDKCLFHPRVLHIITRMTRGGAQENTLATIRGLKAKGYQVLLVSGPSWSKEGEILSEALRAGLDVLILPELCREMDPLKDLLALWKLTGLIRRGRFDLVHTHMSKAGLLGRLAAFFAGVKHIVHTPHGHVFHSYFSAPKERFFLFLERRCARLCHFLIALTESEKREHLERYVGRKDQWAVIPSGVDETLFAELAAAEKQKLCQRLGLRSGAPVVGFLGRLEAVKGPLYFAQAIPAILTAAPHTNFLFVGDGRERAALQGQIKSMGCDRAVTFTGVQARPADYFSLMDVVVVPSLNEGMGRVIVEAGFLAKPVVASRVGGIPDLVLDEQTGLLVPPRDSQALAAAVLRLLRDPVLAQTLGAQLRQRALEGFTEARMVDSMARLYQKILGASASGQEDLNPLSALQPSR